MFGKEEFGFCSVAPWFFAPLVVVCTDTGRYWPDIQRNIPSSSSTGEYSNLSHHPEGAYIYIVEREKKPAPVIIMVEVMRYTKYNRQRHRTPPPLYSYILTAGISMEN